jgi:MurNAc alpha-1-phosphate uridylyltransferase
MEPGVVKAMILAAGVGERMRPLTDHTPKPLLQVGGVPLIEHHIRRLALAGFTELVINVSHLATQITDFCDDGGRWGVSIEWSPEREPLETAGGIFNALPLLGSGPFLVVNGDIWIEYPFQRLLDYPLAAEATAHLVLVANPPQHPLGDFRLERDGTVHARAHNSAGLTYAGVGIYTPALFSGMQPGKLPLRPLLDRDIARGLITGEYHAGDWVDVGTPRRLRELDAAVRNRA